MIRAMSGGWGAMCGALCLSRNALENRVYERNGSGVLVETAMMMQKLSGTTYFADAVACASGGTFIKLPDLAPGDNEPIANKFHALYRELGELSKNYTDAVADDKITPAERKILKANVARLHKVLQELLGLTFQTFCENGVDDGEGDQ